MVVMSHPVGNANVRAVMAALDEARLLDTFYTTVGVRADAAWLDWMPRRLRNALMRRQFKTVHGRLVFHPAMELRRLAGRSHIDAVCYDLDAYVAAKLPRHAGTTRAVYAYEDAALETFRAAQTLGWHRCYDLPIAYWETSQRLLWEEAERLPAWEPTLVGTRDSQEKLKRKTEELALADLILCPSRFVLDSVPAAVRKEKNCLLAPFGSPVVQPVPRPPENFQRPLRVLFAGSMTQRKGLADLFAAIQLLGRSDVELIVMGSPIAPMEFYRSQCQAFRHEGTRPHHEVLELMRQSDVFVLPSLVEGRALVQQEAMSCGLPLIVTANAGGDDLIEEGKTGFLVPIRSAEKLAERIAWCADHRAELPAMRRAAQAKAAQYTWAAYGSTVAGAVRALLGGTTK